MQDLEQLLALDAEEVKVKQYKQNDAASQPKPVSKHALSY